MPKACGPAGDLAADAAQGDDQERLARQLVEDDAGPRDATPRFGWVRTK